MTRNRNVRAPHRPQRKALRRRDRCVARWFERRYSPCDHVWLSYENHPEEKHCCRCRKVVRS